MLSFNINFVQTDRWTDRRTTVKQYAPDLSIQGHKKQQTDRCTDRPTDSYMPPPHIVLGVMISKENHIKINITLAKRGLYRESYHIMDPQNPLFLKPQPQYDLVWLQDEFKTTTYESFLQRSACVHCAN